MKLSLEWLGQYVKLPDLSPREIAHKLTMATAEVEGVETVERAVKGIVVGEIIESTPMSGAEGKTLNIVTVNAGREVFQTVCGAPNVMKGMKSAFAAPGSKIADGHTIREQMIFGRLSRGILCSPKELGWGESHAGVFAFPDSLEAGMELAEIVPETDHIIEIDNKSITHRPDLWGHYGFSRELAAIFGRELQPLALMDSAEGSGLPAFPLRITDPEGCPGYCCLDIDNLHAAFAPVRMQYRLLSVGLRPINLLVDLTNYIMLELGQPMHAFDGERVRDVIVAPFGTQGTFRTLDSVERKMNSEDLMICDHAGPIALAGIMGGEESEIKDNTSRVLLESANFHPARIRRTSLRLGLRTDAGARFEKGQPPYHMALSIRRFVQLLREAGQQPLLRSQLTCAGETGEKGRPLSIRKEVIGRSIGMPVSDDQVCRILDSLGFECRAEGELFQVVIPPHRSVRDVSIPRDIVEEVARIYGYDNITPAMPDIRMRPYVFNRERQKQHKIRRLLSQAKGFVEVHTYGWYDEVWLKRIGYNPKETFRLANPAAENSVRMRRNLLPNLLSLVETNAVHRDSFSLYEVGSVFFPVPDGSRQNMHIGGLAYQSEKQGNLQDLFPRVKGTVEEIVGIANAGIAGFTPSRDVDDPWSVPGAFLEVSAGTTHLGRIGYLAGKLLDVFEKGTQVVWFELEVDALRGPAFPELTYSPIPVYPGSWMDFSILADESSSFAVLEETIGKFTHTILQQVKYLYRYVGKGLPEGKASYSFRFWLGLRERTLTGEDILQFRNAFLQFLEARGLSLR
ncbi:MAG: phenylalanine--tRNA ligase subunit beta [Candidatus Latescibacterota bacterium]